jgi:hypothetical protein
VVSKVCLGLRSRPKASDDLGYLHLAGVLGEKLGEGVDVVAFFARSQQTLGGGANLLEQGCIYHLVPKTVRDRVASRQTATKNAIMRSPLADGGEEAVPVRFA